MIQPMRAFTSFLALIGLCGVAVADDNQPPYAWGNVCHTWHYSSYNAKSPQPVYTTTVAPVNTCPSYDGTVWAFSPCNPPPDTWVDVDLAQFGIPPEAAAVEVDLVGLLIITPGSMQGTPEVAVSFSTPISAMAMNAYQGYTIGQSGQLFVGARSPFSTRAPVHNNKIRYSWHHMDTGPITTEAWGINLSLVGWCD